MVSLLASGFGPSLLFLLECLAAAVMTLALLIAALTCLHWGWLRLVDSLPEAEPRRQKRLAAERKR